MSFSDFLDVFDRLFVKVISMADFFAIARKKTGELRGFNSRELSKLKFSLTYLAETFLRRHCCIWFNCSQLDEDQP